MEANKNKRKKRRKKETKISNQRKERNKEKKEREGRKGEQLFDILIFLKLACRYNKIMRLYKLYKGIGLEYQHSQ